MSDSPTSFLELLRYADRSYSTKEAVEQLVALGMSKARVTQQILEALSTDRAVKVHGERLVLSDRERSGW